MLLHLRKIVHRLRKLAYAKQHQKRLYDNHYGERLREDEIDEIKSMLYGDGAMPNWDLGRKKHRRE